VWTAITFGTGVAASYGVGVARPRADVAYLAVRLDGAQLDSPGVVRLISQLDATAVVDAPTADLHPEAMRQLAALHVDVANGGAGRLRGMPWQRAHTDVAETREVIGRVSGQTVAMYVPHHRMDLFDFISCHGQHVRPVVPNKVVRPSDDSEPPLMQPRHTYLVDGSKATPEQVELVLTAIMDRLGQTHLRSVPLAELR
jgi:hypothetical protein